MSRGAARTAMRSGSRDAGRGSSYSHTAFSYYALQIIQPRDATTGRSRFLFAYPGIEYNIKCAAVGGAWPYTWTLLDAPTGATINSGTGEVRWPNPQSNDTFQVQCTDYNGNTDTASWSVTVSTLRWHFIDAVNGTTVAGGGDGSIGNPWKEIDDFYLASSSDTTYNDDFLYWYTGTYSLSGLPTTSPRGNPVVTMTNKPSTWLAYPGESPIIDHGVSGHADTPSLLTTQSSNLYVEGIRFENPGRWSWHLSSSMQDVVFRNNEWYNFSWGISNYNSGAIHNERAGGPGYYWTIIDNSIDTWSGQGYGLGPFYALDTTLIQGNVFTNIGSNIHGIGPKEGTNNIFIRANTFDDVTGGDMIANLGSTTGGLPWEAEISYNRITTATTPPIGIFTDNYGTPGPGYIFRNTFKCTSASTTGENLLDVRNLLSPRGPVVFNNNILETNNTQYSYQGINGLRVLYYDASQVTVNNMLSGNIAAGILDASGDLTDSYDAYRGTHGYEVFV